MKKTLTFLISVLLIFSGIGVLPAEAAYNSEVDFDSEIVYMESLDRGTVIFNKNSKKRTAEAKKTKIPPHGSEHTKAWWDALKMNAI